MKISKTQCLLIYHRKQYTAVRKVRDLLCVFPVFFPIFEYFCFDKSKFLLFLLTSWYLNHTVPVYASTHTLLPVHVASGVWTVVHALLCHPVCILTSPGEDLVHHLEASPGYQLCFTSQVEEISHQRLCLQSSPSGVKTETSALPTFMQFPGNMRILRVLTTLLNSVPESSTFSL